MFQGRVMVVSDRPFVAAELDALVRAEGHVTRTVPSGDEVLEALDGGMIPDVVVSDMGSVGARRAVGHLERFREMNGMGTHLVVMDRAPDTVAGLDHDALLYPFDPRAVRRQLATAMDEVEQNLYALRGEMLRETARLQTVIRSSQWEMVSALALTIEAKDPYMHGHCARVAVLATRIGAEFGVGSAEQEQLRMAAMVHEVGKMGIPLELLHQTTPLSPTELKLIRSHATVGARIVGSIPSLRSIEPLVRHQHTTHAEMVTEFGADSLVVLLTGILRVSDAYDAMSSDRSYRGGLSHPEIAVLLREGSGTRFHPEATSALLNLFN